MDEGNTLIVLDSPCLQNGVRVDRFDSLVAFEIADVERHNLPNAGGFHDSYKPGVMHLNASYAVPDYHRFPCGGNPKPFFDSGRVAVFQNSATFWMETTVHGMRRLN